MVDDPLREAEEALRQAQDACRAAWDACELALQNLATAQRLGVGEPLERLDWSTTTTALRQLAGDLPVVEESVEVGFRFRTSDGPCEECDLLEGHTIWCSRRWGAD